MRKKFASKSSASAFSFVNKENIKNYIKIQEAQFQEYTQLYGIDLEYFSRDLGYFDSKGDIKNQKDSEGKYNTYLRDFTYYSGPERSDFSLSMPTKWVVDYGSDNYIFASFGMDTTNDAKIYITKKQFEEDCKQFFGLPKYSKVQFSQDLKLVNWQNVDTGVIDIPFSPEPNLTYTANVKFPEFNVNYLDIENNVLLNILSPEIAFDSNGKAQWEISFTKPFKDVPYVQICEAKDNAATLTQISYIPERSKVIVNLEIENLSNYVLRKGLLKAVILGVRNDDSTDIKQEKIFCPQLETGQNWEFSYRTDYDGIPLVQIFDTETNSTHIAEIKFNPDSKTGVVIFIPEISTEQGEYYLQLTGKTLNKSDYYSSDIYIRHIRNKEKRFNIKFQLANYSANIPCVQVYDIEGNLMLVDYSFDAKHNVLTLSGRKPSKNIDLFAHVISSSEILSRNGDFEYRSYNPKSEDYTVLHSPELTFDSDGKAEWTIKFMDEFIGKPFVQVYESDTSELVITDIECNTREKYVKIGLSCTIWADKTIDKDFLKAVLIGERKHSINGLITKEIPLFHKPRKPRKPIKGRKPPIKRNKDIVTVNEDKTEFTIKLDKRFKHLPLVQVYDGDNLFAACNAKFNIEQRTLTIKLSEDVPEEIKERLSVLFVGIDDGKYKGDIYYSSVYSKDFTDTESEFQWRFKLKDRSLDIPGIEVFDEWGELILTDCTYDNLTSEIILSGVKPQAPIKMYANVISRRENPFYTYRQDVVWDMYETVVSPVLELDENYKSQWEIKLKEPFGAIPYIQVYRNITREITADVITDVRYDLKRKVINITFSFINIKDYIDENDITEFDSGAFNVVLIGKRRSSATDGIITEVIDCPKINKHKSWNNWNFEYKSDFASRPLVQVYDNNKLVAAEVKFNAGTKTGVVILSDNVKLNPSQCKLYLTGKNPKSKLNNYFYDYLIHKVVETDENNIFSWEFELDEGLVPAVQVYDDNNNLVIADTYYNKLENTVIISGKANSKTIALNANVIGTQKAILRTDDTEEESTRIKRFDDFYREENKFNKIYCNKEERVVFSPVEDRLSKVDNTEVVYSPNIKIDENGTGEWSFGFSEDFINVPYIQIYESETNTTAVQEFDISYKDKIFTISFTNTDLANTVLKRGYYKAVLLGQRNNRGDSILSEVYKIYAPKSGESYDFEYNKNFNSTPLVQAYINNKLVDSSTITLNTDSNTGVITIPEEDIEGECKIYLTGKNAAPRFVNYYDDFIYEKTVQEGDTSFEWTFALESLSVVNPSIQVFDESGNILNTNVTFNLDNNSITVSGTKESDTTKIFANIISTQKLFSQKGYTTLEFELSDIIKGFEFPVSNLEGNSRWSSTINSNKFIEIETNSFKAKATKLRLNRYGSGTITVEFSFDIYYNTFSTNYNAHWDTLDTVINGKTVPVTFAPKVGDFVRLRMLNDENVFRDYVITFVNDVNLSNSGVSPLMTNFVWECDIQRRKPSQENIDTYNKDSKKTEQQETGIETNKQKRDIERMQTINREKTVFDYDDAHVAIDETNTVENIDRYKDGVFGSLNNIYPSEESDNQDFFDSLGIIDTDNL